MPILCQRFTTSKLQSFEDLSTISTYGFRGEALASISHVAHLTVTTKTEASSCAWRAHYCNGELASAKTGQTAEPKPTAGRGGTQITVEDLFYNVLSRRKSFRSSSEEYAKILDVVGRYAIHCTKVAFSCKKHGDAGVSISVPANSTTVDRIRQIYNSEVARDLVEISSQDKKLGYKAFGWVSNANYHGKKPCVLLFINHRAVESSAIQKAVSQTYSSFLPKGWHPFVYLDLEIEPQRVDVNVHPTKRAVNFLYEDEIIEEICSEIRKQLAAVDSSRTYMMQTLLPGAREAQVETPPPPPMQRRDNNLIRTDASERKITAMLPLGPKRPDGDGSINNGPKYEHIDRSPVHIRFTSIKNLRAAVRESQHDSLTSIFSSHTYVGLVDEQRRIAAIQAGVKLFLVDYGAVCKEYFYQIGLSDFGNFGPINLESQPRLLDLLSLGVAVERDETRRRNRERNAFSQTPDPTTSTSSPDFDVDAITHTVHTQLMSRREMLAEYFSLCISADGNILSLPMLARGYLPSLAKLPRFLCRLGPFVDWSDEQACFHSFLRELAAFYTPEQLPTPPAVPPSLAMTASRTGTERKSKRSATPSAALQSRAKTPSLQRQSARPDTPSAFPKRHPDASARSTSVSGDDEQDSSRGEIDRKDDEDAELYGTDTDADGDMDNNTEAERQAAAEEENSFVRARRSQLGWMLEHVIFPGLRRRLVATADLVPMVVEVADLKGLYRVFERC